MGLHQGDLSHQQARAIAAWWLPICAISIAVILALFGDTGREWLAYSRPAIRSGELWRLASGHFVHLGISHLVMNLAGLLLVWYLTGMAFRRWQWLLITLMVIAGVDAGLWFFQTHLLWYVGLSGLLHGLLAAGILGCLGSQRIEVWILAVALIAKLAYEQSVGPLPGSEESTGGHVIVAAHAYGALAGALAAGLLRIRVRRQASI
ncbi:MAG: rhombosortase [Gammaproteobacteria bacterium]|nr:rhombosortase [Gammaproteobacteria bacterium]MDH3433095.1 rhombosortase [Gammaproteobacteria bacterium]